MVDQKEEWGGRDPNNRVGVSREDLEVHESNLLNTRFPTYYGAKIKNSVKTAGTGRPTGLKSHDYHKMMQHMLPIALRSTEARAHRKDLCIAINEITTVFR